MKVKIFSSGKVGYCSLEDEINDFIKDKKVIDIVQSESYDSKRTIPWYITITILYENK